jgi:hypothetical protein
MPSSDLLSDPWERAQNRNNDEYVRDDTARDHSRMLYSPVAHNVDDLVYKPAADALAY